jgi:acetyl-CoA acetyltransferase
MPWRWGRKWNWSLKKLKKMEKEIISLAGNTDRLEEAKIKKLARNVSIVNVSMTRFGKFPDKSLKELTQVAVWKAIHNAGIDANIIEAAYFSNVVGGLIVGQEAMGGHVFLRHSGFQGIPIVNVEGVCASGAIALREAVFAIAAGLYGVILVVGSRKALPRGYFKAN